MGFGEGCVKFFVSGANFTFALAGLGLIILGVLYKLDLNDYTSAIPEDYQNAGLAPTLTIAIGSIIFVIAFFGCCGAIRESPCLLTTYAVILLIIFLLQVALGVFAFLQIKDKATFEEKVQQTLTKIFNQYYTDKTNSSRDVVNLMQQELECCGTTGPSFWINLPATVPDSCKDSNDSNSYFEDGCVDEFFNFLYRSVQIIGITVLAISVTEIIVSIFSLCLANTIKNRERRFRY
ncbi:hypothetical protein NQ317_005177 [Molorchus minor]|uniref:Tetraspanin n=1 Tax=Molorchus minor TaxID=1323400 RepID=A0ABQ9JCW5_9CUCU|nr:hypothetical protein NQ317_005177 [Molorchus minor]